MGFSEVSSHPGVSGATRSSLGPRARAIGKNGEETTAYRTGPEADSGIWEEKPTLVGDGLEGKLQASRGVFSWRASGAPWPIPTYKRGKST